jgi:hypothetical protein
MFPEDDTSSGSNHFWTMIFLPEYPFQKSSPKIQFSLLKFQFSSTAFGFPRNLLQRLSDFFNGFLISEKPSSTAFQFLQRLSDFQEIQENLLQWLSANKLFIS